MTNTPKNNSNEEANLSQLIKNSDADEKTSIDFFLSLILRRKKIFIIALIIFTSFSLIRTTREKIYNPVFIGEFSLLINDPIKQITTNSFDNVGGIVAAENFMGAAKTNLEQDIPTLRELLLSELVLKDISKEYNLDTKSLSQRLDIKKDPDAKGILDFSLTSKNPKKDQTLLEDLSSLYVNYASLRTQKKLSDGLAFLSNQEPAIKIKNSLLQLMDQQNCFLS